MFIRVDEIFCQMVQYPALRSVLRKMFGDDLVNDADLVNERQQEHQPANLSAAVATGVRQDAFVFR